MPFVRKTNPEGSQSPTDTRKLFIGRTGELLFFVQNILKPDEPTHNIISIWGQGGVGKSTLLARFIDDARSAEFKDYCLTAITDPERIAIIWQISQGLPLYLSLLTSNPRGKVDPTADVVANFLRWIPEKEQIKRQLALDASLFSLPFNQDDLAAFTSLSEKELPLLYSWLIAQPFVQSQDGRYSYHDLAREIFSRHLYQRSKKGYYTTRRALANHYQRLLEETEVEEGKEFYSSEEWLELKLSLVHQLLLLPDEVSHIKAIEHVLYVLEHREIEQVGEIARVLREMSHGQFTNQISPDARKLAEQLQQYIEAGRRNQERLTAATSLLETIILKSPVATELLARIYRMRGEAYYRLKEYQQALADFNRTLELDPDHASAYEGRGWTYKYFKDYKRALSDFDRLAGLQTWVYLSRGSFHSALKQYQQALADYDRALELDPSSAWAYCGRGWAYSDLREYQQAIADYDHALGLDSNYAYAYYGRGFTYLWLKDIKQAKADFIRSWELDPSFVRNGWLVQWTLMCQDKPDSDVVAQLEAIAAIDPQLDSAYNCRGTAQYLCKRFEEAIAELEQAIQLEPERCSAYFWKGMTCASLCSDEDALTAIQKALELELPPILLTPLRWFEQDRPDFYQKYVVPLMARYDLV